MKLLSLTVAQAPFSADLLNWVNAADEATRQKAQVNMGIHAPGYALDTMNLINANRSRGLKVSAKQGDEGAVTVDFETE